MRDKFNLVQRCLAALGLMLMLSTAWAGDEADMADKVMQWEKAYNAGDLDAVVSMYTEDGCRMPPNAETASGSAAIMEQLKSSKVIGPAVKLGLTHAETNDELGYAMGTYQIMAPDGSALDHGKWMNVSMRGADGSWLIHCDIWNSSQPLPAQ